MDRHVIHAAVLHGLGQRPRYETFPAPVAGEEQAVVTVTAAALLAQVEVGEILIDVDAVPLSEVEEAWPRAGSDRRIVFVP